MECSDEKEESGSSLPGGRKGRLGTECHEPSTTDRVIIITSCFYNCSLLWHLLY